MERSQIFLVFVALRQSSEFGEQRHEGGFLTIKESTMRRTECRSNAERGCGGDLARDLDRAIELPSRWGHVLNEAETVGLIGSPFIVGQHIVHRIAPTCPRE